MSCLYTDIFALANTREKTKQEIAQQKLVSALKERDAHIDALQEVQRHICTCTWIMGNEWVGGW